MSEKKPDESPAAGRPILSGQGRRTADAANDRRAAALRENLLKRKRQKRARGLAQGPLTTQS